MDNKTRHVRRDVLNTQVDQDLILFDAEAGKYFATSDVGLAIWRHLSEPLTLEELCQRLQAEYDVEAKECAKDTREFLKRLIEANIVVPV